MIDNFSCMLIDVIKNTLDTCKWNDCDGLCRDYLWTVAFECPTVFNNETYESLWKTLIHICFPDH